MDMTLVYARIANRVVADEYASVMEQIDALYSTAGTSTDASGRDRDRGDDPAPNRVHARMLGNGMCTRPAELDCRIESACETLRLSSRPDPSSCPSCSANGTTPESTVRPTGPCSSRAWSTERPRSRLDTDHTYNAGKRMSTARLDQISSRTGLVA